MMCKTIVALVLVALVASASAYPWRPCRQNIATLKGVSIEGCDPFSRCIIEGNSRIAVNVNYFIHNKIQRPVLRMETENGDYNEGTVSMSGFLGDADDETDEGRNQVIMSYPTAPTNGYKTNSTVQFTVREYGTNVEDAPVCFEVIMDSLNWRD